jgi:hypothetical protein
MRLVRLPVHAWWLDDQIYFSIAQRKVVAPTSSSTWQIRHRLAAFEGRQNAEAEPLDRASDATTSTSTQPNGRPPPARGDPRRPLPALSISSSIAADNAGLT